MKDSTIYMQSTYVKLNYDQLIHYTSNFYKRVCLKMNNLLIMYEVQYLNCCFCLSLVLSDQSSLNSSTSKEVVGPCCWLDLKKQLSYYSSLKITVELLGIRIYLSPFKSHCVPNRVGWWDDNFKTCAFCLRKFEKAVVSYIVLHIHSKLLLLFLCRLHKLWYARTIFFFLFLEELLQTIKHVGEQPDVQNMDIEHIERVQWDFQKIYLKYC